MAQYGFAFHANRCTGCKTCTLACMDYHDLTERPWRSVYEYGGGRCTRAEDGTYRNDTFAYYLSVACNHCDDPACVKVCPTGAMAKDGATGIVAVDPARCMGCGYCAFACPYGAPEVDRAVGHSRKCDGCRERVEAGQAPICVEACPLRALEFGPVEEVSRAGGRGAIDPLPAPELTAPNLYVKSPAHACAAGSGAGRVTNTLEVK